MRDLDLGLVVADLGHAPADAAAGDHFVALLDRRDRGLMLLHPALLGADHQHIENHEDQEPGKDADEQLPRRRPTGPAGATWTMAHQGSVGWT